MVIQLGDLFKDSSHRHGTQVKILVNVLSSEWEFKFSAKNYQVGGFLFFTKRVQCPVSGYQDTRQGKKAWLPIARITLLIAPSQAPHWQNQNKQKNKKKKWVLETAWCELFIPLEAPPCSCQARCQDIVFAF